MPDDIHLKPHRSTVEPTSMLLRSERILQADTRQRARALAEGLGVQPAELRVIGVALMVGSHLDLRHPFFGDVLDGLKERATAGRFDILLFSGRYQDESVESYSIVDRCRKHNVAGIVFMGLGAATPVLEEVIDAAIPCVTVDLDTIGPRCGYVMSDNVDGARQIARHFYSVGKHHMATITGLVGYRVTIDRLFGFRAELDVLGVPLEADHVVEGDFDEESGYEAMGRLLALPSPPDAVFCSSDMMAVGAIRRSQEMGYNVPGDIAIAGFDDDSFASLTRPTLTTIRQDKAGLGAAAGEALLRIIEHPDKSPPIVSLPVELIVRESTMPARRA
jgi:LacI family transcriptional regulator